MGSPCAGSDPAGCGSSCGASPAAPWVKNLPANARNPRDTVGSIAGLGPSPWRRRWQLTPVFLPAKFHGRRSLVGYRPRGGEESDRTEWLCFCFCFFLLVCGFVNFSCFWDWNTGGHGSEMLQKRSRLCNQGIYSGGTGVGNVMYRNER